MYVVLGPDVLFWQRVSSILVMIIQEHKRNFLHIHHHHTCGLFHNNPDFSKKSIHDASCMSFPDDFKSMKIKNCFTKYCSVGYGYCVSKKPTKTQ